VRLNDPLILTMLCRALRNRPAIRPQRGDPRQPLGVKQPATPAADRELPAPVICPPAQLDRPHDRAILLVALLGGMFYCAQMPLPCADARISTTAERSRRPTADDLSTMPMAWFATLPSEAAPLCGEVRGSRSRPAVRGKAAAAAGGEGAPGG
jgi:hypothetical protein